MLSKLWNFLFSSSSFFKEENLDRCGVISQCLDLTPFDGSVTKYDYHLDGILEDFLPFGYHHLAVLPNGNIITSHNSEIRLTNHNLNEMTTLFSRGNTHGIGITEITALSNELIILSLNNHISEVYDIKRNTGVCIAQFKGFIINTKFILLSDGRLLYTYYSSFKQKIIIWNLRDGVADLILDGISPIYDIQEVSEGKIIARCLDNKLRVWNLKNSKNLKDPGRCQTIDIDMKVYKMIVLPNEIVTFITDSMKIENIDLKTMKSVDILSGDCIKVLTPLSNNRIVSAHLFGGIQVKSINSPYFEATICSDPDISDIFVLPDDRLLIVCPEKIQIWRIGSRCFDISIKIEGSISDIKVLFNGNILMRNNVHSLHSVMKILK